MTICPNKVAVSNTPDSRLTIFPSPVAVPMRRVARSWTQTKHTKQPSCFRRYLWSPEWPFFTLEVAGEKSYGPTSPLILLIGCQQLLTRQHTALSWGSCGPISCASGTRFILSRPIRLDTVQGGQTCAIQITRCLFLAASFSPLLWLSSPSPLPLCLPLLLFFFSNVCELFRYMLLIAEKRLVFEFGPAVIMFVTEIKFRTQIYTCTYKFWGINYWNKCFST